MRNLITLILISIAINSNGQLEKYAETPYPVGNIAFNHQGELIYSNHPFFSPDIRVMKYNSKTGESTPFPNKEWNMRRSTDELYLDDVLGIRNDSKGNIWILDMGLKSGITPKLVVWDTERDKLEKIYYIPYPASIKTSQLNDFVIDEKREVVIIADEEIGNGGNGNKAALIVLNLRTGECERLLEGDRTTMPEPLPIMADGKPLNIPGTNRPILVGADGITLDSENEWLYYAPLNGTKLYRIKMETLLSRKKLSSLTEVYASKTNNGGLSIDKKGNIYLTLVGDKAIGVIPSSDRKQVNYVEHPDLIWPDGVSYNAKDQYMYVAAAQLPLAGVFNQGKDLTQKPYYIFRFKPIAEGINGR